MIQIWVRTQHHTTANCFWLFIAIVQILNLQCFDHSCLGHFWLFFIWNNLNIVLCGGLSTGSALHNYAVFWLNSWMMYNRMISRVPIPLRPIFNSTHRLKNATFIMQDALRHSHQTRPSAFTHRCLESDAMFLTFCRRQRVSFQKRFLSSWMFTLQAFLQKGYAFLYMKN